MNSNLQMPDKIMSSSHIGIHYDIYNTICQGRNYTEKPHYAFSKSYFPNFSSWLYQTGSDIGSHNALILFLH